MKRWRMIAAAIAVWVGVAASLAIAAQLDRARIRMALAAGQTNNYSARVAIRGWLEEITVRPVSNGIGSLRLEMVSESGQVTNNLTAMTNCWKEIVYRPRQDITDTSGNALASDAPERYVFCGESIQLHMTNSTVSNAEYEVLIKYENGN